MKSWKKGGACETKPPAWRLAANCRGKLGFSSFSRPPLSQTAPIKTRTHTMPFMYRTPLTGWRVSQSYTHPGTHGVEGWISHLSSLPFSVSRTRRIKLERAAARRIALRPLYLGRPGVEPEPEILRISGGPLATRRKRWRRFRARGSSGSAPRLEWAPPLPRLPPAEEAPPATQAEVPAVETPVVEAQAATTGAREAVRRRRPRRPAATRRRAERLSRVSPTLRRGAPSSSKTQGVTRSWSTSRVGTSWPTRRSVRTRAARWLTKAAS